MKRRKNMPPQMVTCEICGEQVSKRKSLSLQEINGQTGRACRHHPELEQMIAEKKDKEMAEKARLQVKRDEKRKEQQAAENLFIMFAVSEIRVMGTLLNIPPEHFYVGHLLNGTPKHVIDKIKAEVQKQGATMNQTELIHSSIMALELLNQRPAL